MECSMVENNNIFHSLKYSLNSFHLKYNRNTLRALYVWKFEDPKQNDDDDDDDVFMENMCK